MYEGTKEYVDNALIQGFEELEGMDVGSEKYCDTITALSKVYNVRIDEEKLELAEKELNSNTEIKHHQLKNDFIKIMTDTGKAVLIVAGNSIWIKSLMKFEASGHIPTSKAFQFVSKGIKSLF